MQLLMESSKLNEGQSEDSGNGNSVNRLDGSRPG